MHYAGTRRITISVPEELAEAVERDAGRRRVAVSEIVRQSLLARLCARQDGGPALGFSGRSEADRPIRPDERKKWWPTNRPAGHEERRRLIGVLDSGPLYAARISTTAITRHVLRR
ncbi:MAG: ribbon-helix-helix domain-containing protein [Clostridia bacterium]